MTFNPTDMRSIQTRLNERVTDRISDTAPAPLTILAWAHVVLGIVAVPLVLVAFVRFGSGLTGGIPVDLIGLLAVPVCLGIWLGFAMNRGGSWSWYGAGVAYGVVLPTVFLLLAGYLTSPVALPIPQGGAPRWAVLAAGVLTLAGMAAWIYMLTPAVRRRFGIVGALPWVAVGLQVAALVAVGFAADLPAGASETGDAELLRVLGEQPEMVTEDDIAFMQRFLAEGSVEERVLAAWALGQGQHRDALPALLRTARSDEDLDVRINAVAALGAFPDPEVTAAMPEFLADEQLELRTAALRGLQKNAPAELIDALGAILLEDTPELRMLAANAISRTGNRDAIGWLVRATDDPDVEVCSQVAFGMGQIGGAEAVAPLIEMLDDHRWRVRANAAQALGIVGDATAREALKSAVSDPEEQVRWAAEAALEKLP